MITSFPVKKDVSAHLKVGNLKFFPRFFTSKFVRWVVSFVQAFVITSTKPHSVYLFCSENFESHQCNQFVHTGVTCRKYNRALKNSCHNLCWFVMSCNKIILYLLEVSLEVIEVRLFTFQKASEWLLPCRQASVYISRISLTVLTSKSLWSLRCCKPLFHSVFKWS